MFSDCSPELPITRLRFDAGTFPLSLGGGRGPHRLSDSDHHQSDGDHQPGLPGDRLLESELLAETLPSGLLDRLHAWVDELPEDTAA